MFVEVVALRGGTIPTDKCQCFNASQKQAFTARTAFPISIIIAVRSKRFLERQSMYMLKNGSPLFVSVRPII